MQPLFPGVRVWLCWRAGGERALRLSDSAAVGASLSASFPRLPMACVRILFFSLKSSCSSPCLSNWQVEKRSVRERKPPWGRRLAGGGAVGAAGTAAAVREWGEHPSFPPPPRTWGWSRCQRGRALRGRDGAQHSTAGGALKYSLGSQWLLPGMVLPPGETGDPLRWPGARPAIVEAPPFLVVTLSCHKVCRFSSVPSDV